MAFKICPKCSEKSGVRTLKCECGHDYAIKSKEVSTPVVEPEHPHVSRYDLHPVAIPGTGASPIHKKPIIPVKCDNIASIPDWIVKCQAYGEQHFIYYTPMAFRYMARQIWKDKELEKALEIIEQCDI
jgi:hypothetical protein